MNELEYYNQESSSWDKRFTGLAGIRFRNRKFNVVKDMLEGDLILDIGCATGYFTKRYTDLGWNVVGIDMAEKMVEYAKKLYPEVRFLTSYANDLSKHFDNVDCIFMIGVLNRKNLEILDELKKVLTDEGKLIILTGNLDNFVLNHIYNYFTPVPLRGFHINELRSVVSDHGYIVEEVKTFGWIPYRTPSLLFRLMIHVESVLETFLPYKGGTIAMKVRKCC